LWAAVFENREVVFREVVNDGALLVADRGEDGDDFDVGGKDGVLSAKNGGCG
jgi:hypothetical protein